MIRLLKMLVALAIVGAVIAGILLWPILSRGISAKGQPTWIEVSLARAMRHFAIPRADRDRPNPVPASPEAIEAGLEHFADHCATCHANNGSGDTEIGRNLYPKAPDMREAATQNLSDGELFAIIEHGVRMTGMPAWSTGTPDGERESWMLVRFIRHLPKLTPEELAKMESLNPKSPEETSDEEERSFLEGKDGEGQKPKPAPPAGHEHPRDHRE